MDHVAVRSGCPGPCLPSCHHLEGRRFHRLSAHLFQCVATFTEKLLSHTWLSFPLLILYRCYLYTSGEVWLSLPSNHTQGSWRLLLDPSPPPCWTNPALSFNLYVNCSRPLINLVITHWGHSHLSGSFLGRGGRNWTKYSTRSVAVIEQTGITTPLDLLGRTIPDSASM